MSTSKQRRLATVALATLLTVSAGCGGARRASTGISGHASTNGGGRSASARPRSRLVRGALQDPSNRQAARQTAAIDRVLSYTSYIRVGRRRRDDVALTFDDGPGPFTPRILRILERERVPATFFEIGRQAQAYPGLTRREVRDGFAIGDHTQTHPMLGRLGPARQEAEIRLAADHIVAAGAPYPRLLRPPYGSFDAATIGALRRHHMLMVLWTVDTKDFSQPGVHRIVYTALSGARAGAIILMHDGGGPREQTVRALGRIVRKLRSRHFHLVTVPQLVRDDPPLRSQQPPRSLAGVG